MPSKMLNNTSHTIALNTGAGAEELPIVIRKNARSRNMVIRYQPLQHHIALTLPRYVSIAQGLRFVEQKRGWIERQLKHAARPSPLQHGACIPVLGHTYRIEHVGGRGVVRVEGAELLVPGDAAFVGRRVREWLKAQLYAEVTTLAQTHAARIGKQVSKVTLRDTTSRWGSCNHKGHLSFSWRLVFAPYDVMEYVVCHEVAHLQHMDHSPAFWRTVELLQPGHERQRQWLQTQGSSLYLHY
jgi:predicted metal-dependent hydrolase